MQRNVRPVGFFSDRRPLSTSTQFTCPRSQQEQGSLAPEVAQEVNKLEVLLKDDFTESVLQDLLTAHGTLDALHAIGLSKQEWMLREQNGLECLDWFCDSITEFQNYLVGCDGNPTHLNNERLEYFIIPLRQMVSGRDSILFDPRQYFYAMEKAGIVGVTFSAESIIELIRRKRLPPIGEEQKEWTRRRITGNDEDDFDRSSMLSVHSSSSSWRLQEQGSQKEVSRSQSKMSNSSKRFYDGSADNDEKENKGYKLSVSSDLSGSSMPLPASVGALPYKSYHEINDDLIKLNVDEEQAEEDEVQSVVTAQTLTKGQDEVFSDEEADHKEADEQDSSDNNEQGSREDLGRMLFEFEKGPALLIDLKTAYTKAKEKQNPFFAVVFVYTRDASLYCERLNKIGLRSFNACDDEWHRALEGFFNAPEEAVLFVPNTAKAIRHFPQEKICPCFLSLVAVIDYPHDIAFHQELNAWLHLRKNRVPCFNNCEKSSVLADCIIYISHQDCTQAQNYASVLREEGIEVPYEIEEACKGNQQSFKPMRPENPPVYDDYAERADGGISQRIKDNMRDKRDQKLAQGYQKKDKNRFIRRDQFDPNTNGRLFCIRCRETTHLVRSCPLAGSLSGIKQGVPGQEGNAIGGNPRCYVCAGNWGKRHNSSTCPYRHPESFGQQFLCWNCASSEHRLKLCKEDRYQPKPWDANFAYYDGTMPPPPREIRKIQKGRVAKVGEQFPEYRRSQHEYGQGGPSTSRQN